MSFFQFVLMGKTPKNLFLGVVLFSSLLCFVCLFLGLGHYFSLLVSFPPIILSTIFLFTSTKKKPISDENPSGNLQKHNQNVHLEKEVKDKVKEELHQEVETENHVESELKPILESIEENEIAQQSKEGLGVEEDSPSESDFSESSEGFELKITPTESDFSESSESFELKWQENPPISESFFSEEDENLIEISLPGSETSGLEEKLQPNLPDFLPESIFSQKGFLELLADINEINEEDNLIEIDISVGSIKCPRFEIEA